MTFSIAALILQLQLQLVVIEKMIITNYIALLWKHVIIIMYTITPGLIEIHLYDNKVIFVGIY
jgi:hypothetical protein